MLAGVLINWGILAENSTLLRRSVVKEGNISYKHRAESKTRNDFSSIIFKKIQTSCCSKIALSDHPVYIIGALPRLPSFLPLCTTRAEGIISLIYIPQWEGTGQSLWGTRAGTIDRGEKTLFRKKIGGGYFFSKNVRGAKSFFQKKLGGDDFFRPIKGGEDFFSTK